MTNQEQPKPTLEGPHWDAYLDAEGPSMHGQILRDLRAAALDHEKRIAALEGK